jgi:hypothetical protein
MSFRDSIKLISPPWLAGRVTERIGYAVGLVLDATNDQIREGVRARMPGEGTPDALPFIGNDRQIDRGPRESADSYAARLREAFDTWRAAGSARAMLGQLRAYFLGTASPPPIRIVSDRSVWHTIDNVTGIVTKYVPGSGLRNWRWDAFSSSLASPPGSPRWWRAWVVIDSSSGPWEPWYLGDPNVSLGDGHTLGSTATVEEVTSIRKIVRKWRPANAHLVNVIVTFDAALFDTGNAPGAPMPDGDYDDYAARTLDAAFWEGASE